MVKQRLTLRLGYVSAPLPLARGRRLTAHWEPDDTGNAARSSRTQLLPHQSARYPLPRPPTTLCGYGVDTLCPLPPGYHIKALTYAA